MVLLALIAIGAAILAMALHLQIASLARMATTTCLLILLALLVILDV